MNLPWLHPCTLQSCHTKVGTIKVLIHVSSPLTILAQKTFFAKQKVLNVIYIYTPRGVESTSKTLMMSGELDAAGMKRNNHCW